MCIIVTSYSLSISLYYSCATELYEEAEVISLETAGSIPLPFGLCNTSTKESPHSTGVQCFARLQKNEITICAKKVPDLVVTPMRNIEVGSVRFFVATDSAVKIYTCLLYTSDAADE